MGAASQPRVLVVEDDDDLRCLLERELTDFGAEVTAVPNAEQAIALLNCAEAPCAVTITDIRMPGIDGVELTRWIKQCCPEVEVILLTGYASLQSAMAAVRLGASDYLTKPLRDISELYDSLRAALAKRELAEMVLGWPGPVEPAAGRAVGELLDHFPLGVVLLDSHGCVLEVNAKAQAIFAEQDGIRVGSDGRLYAACSMETRELRQLHGPRPTERRRVGAMAISRPSGCLPLSVLVATTPVTPGAAEGAQAPRVAGAVFIGDPEQRGPSAEWLLRELHGLTPAEARLTSALLEGHSVDSAAAMLGVSSNTARTHLKRTFAKTGTNRQADLVSLLLYSPALLHVREQDEGERG